MKYLSKVFLNTRSLFLTACIISMVFVTSCEESVPEPQETFQDDPPKEDENNKPPPCLVGC